MKHPKIAIFYDWLNQWGGAERLLLDILHVFPDSQLFTCVYNPQTTPWLKVKKITTTWLNNFSFFKKNSYLSGLLQPIAIESLDFNSFDIVISLTSQSGKSLITPPTTCFICYCLTPNRYLYQRTYPILVQPFINIYKKIDHYLAQRPDYYLTISQTVQSRIKQIYNLPSNIVFPGVDTDKFIPSNTIGNENYFLVVSRLVNYKRVDIAIDACIKLRQNLKIIGSGKEFNKLKHRAKHYPNIEFLGQVDDQHLINLYQHCLALICPQFEDFGLTPLEAQACGKPVIAFDKGGLSETIINNQTGIFFHHQNHTSLIKAIKKFYKMKFKKYLCRQNSEKFSRYSFMLKFKQQINSIWSRHQQEAIRSIS